MAKINNQAVIQKLIDELRLYPGTDVIPTELAEKILPVFLINEQNINFEAGGVLRLVKDSALNDSDKSITVPTGKKWEIIHISAILACTATVGNRNMEFTVSDGTDVYWRATSAQANEASDTALFMLGKDSIEPAYQDALTGDLLQWLPGISFTIPEDHVIRVFERNDVDAAADDLTTFFMVRETNIGDDFVD